MSIVPETLSTIQINNEVEKKTILKMDYTKDDSVSISINSQITTDDSTNTSIRPSSKNEINTIQLFFISTSLLLNNNKSSYVEKEFFTDKEDSAFNLLLLRKKKENKKNEENKEVKEYKKDKPEIKKDKIDIKEEANNNLNNVNISKVKDVNEYKNMQINIEKNKIKNDNYAQAYRRNDFNERPPKVSTLFMHDYGYEKNNIFSHSNDTSGNIKESKKIPNIFFNHLLINKGNNERYIITSLNKRNNGKLLTFIFYAP